MAQMASFPCPYCGHAVASGDDEDKLAECPNCGELKRPHHVCSACGHYGDKEVVAMADEVDLDEDAA